MPLAMDPANTVEKTGIRPCRAEFRQRWHTGSGCGVFSGLGWRVSSGATPHERKQCPSRRGVGRVASSAAGHVTSLAEPVETILMLHQRSCSRTLCKVSHSRTTQKLIFPSSSSHFPQVRSLFRFEPTPCRRGRSSTCLQILLFVGQKQTCDTDGIFFLSQCTLPFLQ